MIENVRKHYLNELEDIIKSGLFKKERIITSPQGVRIDTTEYTGLLNMCANKDTDFRGLFQI